MIFVGFKNVHHSRHFGVICRVFVILCGGGTKGKLLQKMLLLRALSISSVCQEVLRPHVVIATL